ncbi:MAG: hypothetical protein JOY96_05245 [Verrucomicrobia bacterium]|nr:hypothetical protein [Verrucomicrobiota bacterium]
MYWSSNVSLYPDKLLVLMAGRKRLIRHFVQITNVSPELAPDGVHLISATILGEPDRPGLVDDAESEICEVFPRARGKLEFLRSIQIPYGVPLQPPGRLFGELFRKPYQNVWLAGDQISYASTEGVARSGAAVAHDIARTF